MTLQRLIKDARRKVFLILDRLPVHRAAMVREWLARHKAQIEVFHLPSYSPELNPDEGLNADLKQNIRMLARRYRFACSRRQSVTHDSISTSGPFIGATSPWSHHGRACDPRDPVFLPPWPMPR